MFLKVLVITFSGFVMFLKVLVITFSGFVMFLKVLVITFSGFVMFLKVLVITFSGFGENNVLRPMWIQIYYINFWGWAMVVSWFSLHFSIFIHKYG